MNFRPLILKKKYCYVREFTAESQPNIYSLPNYLYTVLIVLFFEINGEIFWGQWPGTYLKKTKRFGSQKHSVRFNIIRKNESAR